MSFSRRASRWANSGIVVPVGPADYAPFALPGEPELAGVAFQEAMERVAARMGGGDLVAPAQTTEDFLLGRLGAPGSLPPSSYRLGVRSARADQIYPEPVNDALRRALERFEKGMPGCAPCLPVWCALRAGGGSPAERGFPRSPSLVGPPRPPQVRLKHGAAARDREPDERAAPHRARGGARRSGRRGRSAVPVPASAETDHPPRAAPRRSSSRSRQRGFTLWCAPRGGCVVDATGCASGTHMRAASQGEGAGYAGGIVSAAVDGMNAAQAIIRELAADDGRQTTPAAVVAPSR